MKLIFLMAILAPSIALASYSQCPNGWAEKNSRAFNIIKALAGTKKVADCNVEIHVCNPSQPGNDDLVGDVLVTKKNQKEFYVPLYVNQSTDNVTSRTSAYQDEFHYHFEDENANPLHGEKDKNYLNIIFDLKSKKILHLEIWSKDRHYSSKLIIFRTPAYVLCEAPEFQSYL